jgi:hypothetical protein
MGERKKRRFFQTGKLTMEVVTTLQKDVLQLGHEKFVREILHLCKSKGECGYLEAKEQFVRGVMESEDYYNTWIMVRVRKSHIKEYNARLSQTTKE